ncbi:TIGR04104 family putative zinc finger protein [Guptibacillus algicola]|uniref:TIGR04104 family putative zinc finger protein n=1 Tax=Guptibacillus algicola TaxID=225844 RepID=UPI001CD5A641|nr:TIGR04104 family putative zinc finger protein [Alkalihalobacillus algicola]MCA0987410.1 hypothetical protein [Alkalihalobacillus algicola]
MVLYSGKGVSYIPTCQNCSRIWSWKETLKSQPLLFGSGLTCPHCGESQYLTEKGQMRQVLLSLLILFSIIAIYEQSSAGPLLKFLSFVAGATALVLLTPFVMEVSNKRSQL